MWNIVIKYLSSQRFKWKKLPIFSISFEIKFVVNLTEPWSSLYSHFSVIISYIQLLFYVVTLNIRSIFIVFMGLAHCSDPGVAGDLPPPELFCERFVACESLPRNSVCGLANDGCWGAYTFINDCQLELYNCEHPSDRK